MRKLTSAVIWVVVVAAAVDAFPLAAPAHAAQSRSLAASDGLALPVLAGGVVLAFAVGISAGTLTNRRRSARRRAATQPVTAPPQRPEPRKRAPKRARPAKPARRERASESTPSPEPRVAEPPAPPEPPQAAEPPAAPPAEPPAAAEPEPEPPVEPPVAREPEPEPRSPAEPPARAQTEPRSPAEPPARAEPEPLRVVRPSAAPEPAPPPRRTTPLRPVPSGPARAAAAGAPLAESPEVPRLEAATSRPAPPATSLDEAPEALWVQPAARPAPARRSVPIAEWPAGVHELWTCEIDWKPGYRKSNFRAVAGPPRGVGKPRAVAESAPVRWTFMSDPHPPTPELAIRVRALVEALEDAGWQHIGRGRRWYAQRFVWRGEGEPQPLDVRDVAEPPER